MFIRNDTELAPLDEQGRAQRDRNARWCDRFALAAFITFVLAIAAHAFDDPEETNDARSIHAAGRPASGSR